MTRTNSIKIKYLINKQEIECIRLLASGLKIPEIAIEQRYSEFSVNIFLRNARKKLQTKNNAQMIARAFTEGILD